MIKIRRIHPAAKMPLSAHGVTEDAGYDLFSTERVPLIPGGPAVQVPTGLIFELPPGIEGQIRSRSGLAAREGVVVLNSPGTIDPGYRGEIKVLLFNHGKKTYWIEQGDRIAQVVFASYLYKQFTEVDALTETVRGEGGCGSTGVK